MTQSPFPLLLSNPSILLLLMKGKKLQKDKNILPSLILISKVFIFMYDINYNSRYNSIQKSSMIHESEIPVYQANQFNIFGLMGFELYEWLPRWYKWDPNPIMCSNISRSFSNIAWHSPFQTTFPYTLQYQALRAIGHDDLPALTDVLKNPKFEINTPIDKKYNLTALQIAAIKNQYPIIELLLLYGANINLPDQHGNSPLMLAIMNNSLEAINSLMKNGCNRNQKNKYGITPIERAESTQRFDFITNFIRQYPETERKFPKFRVKLDIEDKIKDPTWEYMKSYKVYSDKMQVYPFNNFKGLYRVCLSNYQTLEDMMRQL